MSREIVTDGTHIPEPVKAFDYWVMWDFDVKQPRAPWHTGHSYIATWGQDKGENPRTDYNQAAAAANLGPELLHQSYPFPDDPPEKVGPTLLLPHEGDDTPGPDVNDPPLLFVDYDDVIVDGEIPDDVWDVAASIDGPLFVSSSFFKPEKDAAGLHQLAFGELPGAATTVNAELPTRGHVEIYKRSRMTGFTWEHVRGTPTDEFPDATDAVADVVDAYADTATKRRASATVDDERAHDANTGVSRDAPIQKDTTDDMDDVFAAIRNVGPGDIRLKSVKTEDNGSRKSFDPSWDGSKSGERLGYDSLKGGGGWIYRKGNRRVDALQVVAAEERITSDVTDYPDGTEFWEAVNALRERGASIPYFEGSDGTHPDYLRLFEEGGDDDSDLRKALLAVRAGGRR